MAFGLGEVGKCRSREGPHSRGSSTEQKQGHGVPRMPCLFPCGCSLRFMVNKGESGKGEMGKSQGRTHSFKFRMEEEIGEKKAGQSFALKK